MERQLSRSDLRSQVLLLSEKGHRAVKEHLAAETQVMEHLLEDFKPDEKETLITLLDKIIENASKPG